MRLILSALGVAFLTGCTPVMQTPSQTASANMTEMTLTRGALSGVLQKIDFYDSLTPACESQGYPTIRILTQPKNGSIQPAQVEDYSNFKQDNVRYVCNTKKVPGTALQYQSMPGYVGTDIFTIEILTANGGYRKLNYIVNVR
jgi:hypothetical protein